METLSRLSYNQASVTDSEFDEGLVIKQTINEGLNDGAVLAFRVPAHPHRFTDLSTAMLSLEYVIQKGGGQAVATDMVFLEPGGMHSLFQTCDVRFNGVLVSSMTSYPHSAALCRYLGTSQNVREGVYDELDGSWPIGYLKRLSLTDLTDILFMKPVAAALGEQCFVGRIFSDVLSSCRQLLPPGVSMEIDLRRAANHFSLCSNKEQTHNFKVKIKSASLLVRRLTLRPPIHSRVMDSLQGGATLQFNRLDCRIMSLKAGVRIWKWLDCLNGAPLPNRLYMAMVSQEAYYGNINQCGTYLYHNKLSNFGAKLNGHDLLVSPLKSRFKVEDDGDTDQAASDAKEPFLALAEVSGQLSDPMSSLRVHFRDFVNGVSVFALELGKAGDKAGSSGTVDLELGFAEGAAADSCVLVFIEKTQSFTVYPKAA